MLVNSYICRRESWLLFGLSFEPLIISVMDRLIRAELTRVVGFFIIKSLILFNAPKSCGTNAIVGAFSRKSFAKLRLERLILEGTRRIIFVVRNNIMRDHDGLGAGVGRMECCQIGSWVLILLLSLHIYYIPG